MAIFSPLTGRPEFLQGLACWIGTARGSSSSQALPCVTLGTRVSSSLSPTPRHPLGLWRYWHDEMFYEVCSRAKEGEDGLQRAPEISTEYMYFLHSHRDLGNYKHLCKYVFHYITISCLHLQTLTPTKFAMNQPRIIWLIPPSCDNLAGSLSHIQDAP